MDRDEVIDRGFGCALQILSVSVGIVIFVAIWTCMPILLDWINSW